MTIKKFLQNKYVRFTGIILGLILVLLVAGSVWLASLNDARNLGMPGAPTSGQSIGNESVRAGAPQAEYDTADGALSYPRPTPSGYTSNLEAYELTDYTVAAQTRRFDTLCSMLRDLKADDAIDFQTLSESTNRCHARFYVAEARADAVVSEFAAYDEVTVDRTTRSVTRHREQLESRIDILRQQLASVDRSLSIAETEFDEIASFARSENDAATLSEAIREKLNLIDTLTQRKISLTAQIDQQLQAAADLNERLGVVQFDVTISRAFPHTPNEFTQKWAAAWEDLKDTFTETLIWMTTIFGIFLLWLLRLAVYGVVVLVVARALWKFGRYLWNRW